jgi:GntR family transcriptional regulator
MTSTLCLPMTSSINRRQGFKLRLDMHSGVPVYRQIIDQVIGGMAAGTLTGGDQLPTVRQLAVDLSINPNTVIRAYRELELRGLLETQQGTGTFITHQKVERNGAERQRRLTQLIGEFLSRAGAEGFALDEVLAQMQSAQEQAERERKRR